MFKSPKAQRLVASSITALLAANAVVLVTGIIGDDAKATPPAANVETITFIQHPDGSQTVVDPTTPAGYRAIDDAHKRGEQVVTVPAAQTPAAVRKQTTTTSTTLKKPVAAHG